MAFSEVLIIIPAYNEEETISEVIQDLKEVLKKHHLSAEILIINDGSTDNTGIKAKKTGCTVLNLIINLGYWRALQTGFLYGYYKNFKYFITMDADGQHLASEILPLIKELKEKKVDVVIGSYPERGGTAKKLVWFLFKFLTGLNVKDLTSGFRGYSRKAIEILIDPKYTLFDNADLASLLILKQHNCKILEVPTEIRERKGGVSKLFSSSLKILKYLIYSVIISISLKKLK